MALCAYARTNADKRTLCAYGNTGEKALCESWEWFILGIFSNALA